MGQDKEISFLLNAIGEKAQVLFNKLKAPPFSAWSLSAASTTQLIDDVYHMWSTLYQSPKLLTELSCYSEKAIRLWQTFYEQWQTGTLPPIKDKRFHHPLWVDNPFYNLLCQHYLLFSQHVDRIFAYDISDKKTKRYRFILQQWVNTLSPSHFLQTNPQVLSEALQTNGKSILKGLLNFLNDLADNPARLAIKMTDTKAFRLGRDVATTKGKVIYRNDLMELIQYSPQTPTVSRIPLLIIPPWINKYYILDLRPENSFVGWLVSQGITVFIISWVNPTAKHQFKRMAHYLKQGPLKAISVIKKRLAVEEVHTLGFCIGGTLLSMLLAYYRTQKKPPVCSATFLTTLIDFEDPGDIGLFIDEESLLLIEKHLKAKGYLEGYFMSSAFNALRANDLIWSFFINHYLLGQSHQPFDLLFWNSDSTNMPALMLMEYLRLFYLNNELIKANAITIDQTPLNIAQMTTPSFFVATEKDHIAPWKSVYKGFKLIPNPKEFILAGSGHIAGIINPPTSEKYSYYVNKKQGKNADDWLASAIKQPGSWWPYWLKWLTAQANDFIPASTYPIKQGKSLMNAPGRYVKSPAES